MRIPESTRRGFILGSVAVALAAVGCLAYLPSPTPLRAGVVSPHDVVAPRTVEFVDWERTEVLRQQVARAVPPAYRAVVGASEQAKAQVRQLAESVLSLRADRTWDQAALRARLERLGLREEALRASMVLDRAGVHTAREAATAALHRILARPLRPEDLPGARTQVVAMLRERGLDGPVLALARWFAERSLRPTLIVDEVQTQRLQEAARAGVEPVRIRVLKDEVVVRRGEVVSPDHVRKLQALGLVPRPWQWERAAGTVVMVVVLVVLLATYLIRFQPEVWHSERQLLLLGLLIILTALATRLSVTRLHPFLLPAPATSMLLAVLVNPKVAAFTATLLAVLTGVFFGPDLRLAVMGYVGTLVGVFSVRRIQRRTDLAYAGVLVGVASAAAALAMDLVSGSPVREAFLSAGVGVVGGVLCGVLATGALPHLEDWFGLVTPIKLLELSSPSHPLLRRLQLEAPGTYHHTLMVANLAEAAAEAVGADPLLTRVGTYYHDVGKLRRPGFFVENQIGAHNPHERLTPRLSALAVAAHVKDGIELARQHKLPQVVADFISQHHGTSLMVYFYHRALEQQEGPVDPTAFRYDGPKPQSREAAIVMLADAVEAAARSVHNPTPERIRELVRRIVRERLEDGQLDECDLTFRDLERIAEVFTRLLVSMFHPRVEYPEVSLESHRRRKERRLGTLPVSGRPPRAGP